MRNRESYIRSLERIESSLKTMEFLMSRGGTSNDFKTMMNNIQDQVDFIKSLVEREELSPNEINPIRS
jgi:hypothetical protein